FAFFPLHLPPPLNKSTKLVFGKLNNKIMVDHRLPMLKSKVAAGTTNLMLMNLLKLSKTFDLKRLF
ncbi:MAG: hypothetical protein PVF29_18770, partial [Desulfobacterales bacterium]